MPTIRAVGADALAAPEPRPRGRPKKAAGAGSGSNQSFEAKLWQTADALRSNMDAAEYQHVVLGLILLKDISDAFEAKHAELEADVAAGADPEDPDEYRATSIFWVPKEARWAHLRRMLRSPRSARPSMTRWMPSSATTRP
jgi:type I restriction enzyme M protein